MTTISADALPDALSDSAREFIARSHRLLIGAERPEAADGRTFATIDPATGREIADVAHAGAEDVARAVAAAREAFASGPWSSMPAAGRERLMHALADAVEARAEEFAQIESLDNGKPVGLAQYVDVAGAVGHLRYFAGWPTKIEGGVLPVGAPGLHVYTRREPVGVCGQIIPWNFPLLMAAWKLGPALAAGCTVVLKPAEQTPLSALRLGELALEVGFPPGVLNVLTGDGETGAALVDHPDVDKIAFTGSTAVGREIGAKAGRALKRVTLELGGKSPNVILPDADIEAAVKGSFQAIYFNSGQACNAGSRLFVPADRYDEVVSGLAEAAGAARLGPGLAADTQLGPVVSAEQRERVLSYIQSGREQGAELLAGGESALDESGGYFIAPTLFSTTDDDLRIAREEIFGPVLVASPYDTLEEVAERANAATSATRTGWRRCCAPAWST
jgi:aldehyde dehydrogenase (NAD+)